MDKFTNKLYHFDFYQNFSFRLKWDGKYVAGLSKCSALMRTIEVSSHRDCEDTHSSQKQLRQL